MGIPRDLSARAILGSPTRRPARSFDRIRLGPTVSLLARSEQFLMAPYRICPGRFLADEIGFAVATMILWAFSIERIEGPTSPEEVKWVDSALRFVPLFGSWHSLTPMQSPSPPLPFKVRFRPRTDKLREILENS